MSRNQIQLLEVIFSAPSAVRVSMEGKWVMSHGTGDTETYPLPPPRRVAALLELILRASRHPVVGPSTGIG